MTTLLRGVRVFDGERFGDPADLAIVDGSIADAAQHGSGSEVAAGGGFLIPGLIDAHVHLAGPRTQELLAASGVTTALDMSSPPQLVASMRGRAGVADIRSAMLALTSPTSAHARRMSAMPGASETHVAGVADAADAVARRIAQGADYLKIVVDLPGFDRETVEALVDAAHRAGLRTVAHASRSDAVDLAERAGVDVLTHVPLDRAIDAAQAARLAESGRVVVPTLTMMRAIVERAAATGAPGPRYDPARASVRTLHAARVPVIAGTDANETPAAPASPEHGSSLHDELALLVDAGLSPVDALRAATSTAADHFGLADRGRIAPGLRADLVLLDADPTIDIAATRGIRGVWIAGDRVVGDA
ncbi:amidohydrolase [Agromyces rhizosphaerae]|uniref:Amidohydrolase n=1 Tax=Agromyces rhizosphaerae TaxID=88374 RepID=A0A9W6CUY5_9MICO|nr:amidohydrolase family protein [Agromyces rhizosphaerae]GLI26937.1 amidohydrolase [Agromyces rhizosphaerae]